MTSRAFPSIGGITLSYAGFYDERFEEFIEFAANRGFGAVQLIPDQTPNLISEIDHSRVIGIKRLLEQYNMDLSVHSIFYDINVVSLVPEVQDFAISTVGAVTYLADRLGARNVTVHPGYMFPGWRSSEAQSTKFWVAARRGIERLSLITRENGIPISIENGSYYVTTRVGSRRTPLHVGVSVAEMRRLMMPLLPGLGLCLDIGKAESSEDGVQGFVNAFRDYIKQVQIGSARGLMEFLNAWGSLDSSAPEIVYEGASAGLDEFIRATR